MLCQHWCVRCPGIGLTSVRRIISKKRSLNVCVECFRYEDRADIGQQWRWLKFRSRMGIHLYKHAIKIVCKSTALAFTASMLPYHCLRGSAPQTFQSVGLQPPRLTDLYSKSHMNQKCWRPTIPEGVWRAEPPVKKKLDFCVGHPSNGWCMVSVLLCSSYKKLFQEAQH